MLGLDAAGKTSTLAPCAPVAPLLNTFLLAILYKLKLNQSVTTIPTGTRLPFLTSHCDATSEIP